MRPLRSLPWLREPPNFQISSEERSNLAMRRGESALFLGLSARRFFLSGRILGVLFVGVRRIDGCFGALFRAGDIGAFWLTSRFLDFVLAQASGVSGVSCHGAASSSADCARNDVVRLATEVASSMILRILFMVSGLRNSSRA
jgi:hypothetical protein